MSPRRWRVLGLLGEGAFGAVYRARAEGARVQRDVAIKVLHADRAATPGVVARLRDEARMLALIRHRAIVRVDDLVQLDGSWSIVMEYVEGCDVGALLRDGPLPPAVALAVAEEVASALHAAWTQPGPEGAPLRLVHRDVKPNNLRLTAQGDVKLLDFGVARADFAEREAGSTRSAFGTLVYMAPERFEGRDVHEADVYALGVSLFEMLTGVSPGRLASDPGRQPPGGTVACHWADIATVSTDLHALLARMLAYAPAQRPSAREVAEVCAELRVRLRAPRLSEWAAERVPPRLARVSPALRADERTGTLLVEGARPAPPVGAGRAWALGVAAAVASLALAGALGWAAWTLGRGPVAAVGAAPDAALPAPAPDAALPAPAPDAALPAPAPDAAFPTPASGATAASDVGRGGVAGGEPPPPPEARGPGPRARPAPEAAPTGEVRVVGDEATVALEGPDGATASAGSVAAGVYVAVVRFVGGAEPIRVRGVVVSPGRTTTLTCSARFANCTVRAD